MTEPTKEEIEANKLKDKILRKLLSSKRVLACCGRPEFECKCDVGFLPSTLKELFERILCLELNLNPNNHQLYATPSTVEEKTKLIVQIIQDEKKAIKSLLLLRR